MPRGAGDVGVLRRGGRWSNRRRRGLLALPSGLPIIVFGTTQGDNFQQHSSVTFQSVTTSDLGQQRGRSGSVVTLFGNGINSNQLPSLNGYDGIAAS